jgi:hypothetical protein
MFLFISFLVYSSSIFDIVMICNDFMHMFVDSLVQFRIGLGDRNNVGVVLRLYLSTNAPYRLGLELVDRGCDRPVESSVFHVPFIGPLEPPLVLGE